MRKTEQYQLNQWDRSDRILMEDFNGDNARIDAALAALRTLGAGESARLDAALAALERRSRRPFRRPDRPPGGHQPAGNGKAAL